MVGIHVRGQQDYTSPSDGSSCQIVNTVASTVPGGYSEENQYACLATRRMGATSTYCPTQCGSTHRTTGCSSGYNCLTCDRFGDCNSCPAGYEIDVQYSDCTGPCVLSGSSPTSTLGYGMSSNASVCAGKPWAAPDLTICQSRLYCSQYTGSPVTNLVIPGCATPPAGSWTDCASGTMITQGQTLTYPASNHGTTTTITCEAGFGSGWSGSGAVVTCDNGVTTLSTASCGSGGSGDGSNAVIIAGAAAGVVVLVATGGAGTYAFRRRTSVSKGASAGSKGDGETAL